MNKIIEKHWTRWIPPRIHQSGQEILRPTALRRFKWSTGLRLQRPQAHTLPQPLWFEHVQLPIHAEYVLSTHRRYIYKLWLTTTTKQTKKIINKRINQQFSYLSILCYQFFRRISWGGQHTAVWHSVRSTAATMQLELSGHLQTGVRRTRQPV